MKVLLINSEFPDTYWSFRHALPFEGKRCAFPPLGLLTVSALLPPDWERRLIDLKASLPGGRTSTACGDSCRRLSPRESEAL
jgi:hypothetical protein